MEPQNFLQYYRPTSGAFDINKYAQTSPGCVLWLKADAGVTIDANQTPASDGDLVRKWTSSAWMNSDFAFQVAEANRPVFHANVLNGLPAISFTAANKTSMYTQNAANYNIFTPSIFCVFRFNGGVSYNNWIFGKCGGTGGGSSSSWYKMAFLVRSDTTAVWSAGADSNNSQGIVNGSFRNWNIVSSIVKHNALINLNINGIDNFATAAKDNHSYNTAPFVIGEAFQLGAGWSNCDIAEIIIFKYSVPDWLKKQVINYLSNKWGIAVTNTSQPVLPNRPTSTSRPII